MSTLVVLAAGIGTRFGGDKQIEAVGPAGETIIDYSVHDAISAGFTRVVLVVRNELRNAIAESILARWQSRIPVELVVQPSRFAADQSGKPGKPWGTAHAILCAAPTLREPFAVINGDDFYGVQALRAAQSRCNELAVLPPDASRESEYAVFGFRLADTMTGGNAVKRALLSTHPDSLLSQIEEVEVHSGSGRNFDVSGPAGIRTVTGDELVSMNLWVFTPGVFRQLDDAFIEFSYMYGDDEQAELMLPVFVNELLRENRARVRVILTEGKPAGLTHRGDRDQMRELMEDFAKDGTYPSPLWK